MKLPKVKTPIDIAVNFLYNNRRFCGKEDAMSIKRCREQAGKSVAEVAEYMEVSNVAAYKWERGKNMPSADKLLKLAKYLDCTVEDLLSKE